MDNNQVWMSLQLLLLPDRGSTRSTFLFFLPFVIFRHCHMNSQQRRQAASGSCPWGGFFQACATGFRGCCLVDACTNGCPTGKDTTNGNEDASKSSAPTSTGQSDATSASASSARSTSTSNAIQSSVPNTSSSLFTTSTRTSVNDVLTTESSIGLPTPSSAEINAPTHIGHPHPTAVIIGGVLGGVITLMAVSIVVFLCLRKKNQKVYLSSKYPSPLAGSDMSKEFCGNTAWERKSKKSALHRSQSGSSQDSTPQLDSREIGQRHEAAHRSPMRTFAELPGEAIPWPGQSGNGHSP
ncbi:hypothetical protein NX059_004186 [Plenodomus lindquistii]|nr:hypothetical protein NX059_004186 [Plenodomus lindquistii]